MSKYVYVLSNIAMVDNMWSFDSLGQQELTEIEKKKEFSYDGMKTEEGVGELMISTFCFCFEKSTCLNHT